MEVKQSRRELEEELKVRRFEMLDWTISEEYQKWLKNRCEELESELLKMAKVEQENRKCDIRKAKTIIYQGSYPFKYYLLDMLTNKPIEVSEEEFFSVVGYNRRLVPMHYDQNNINRQNFFLDDTLIAYRER